MLQRIRIVRISTVHLSNRSRFIRAIDCLMDLGRPSRMDGRDAHYALQHPVSCPQIEMHANCLDTSYILNKKKTQANRSDKKSVQILQMTNLSQLGKLGPNQKSQTSQKKKIKTINYKSTMLLYLFFNTIQKSGSKKMRNEHVHVRAEAWALAGRRMKTATH